MKRGVGSSINFPQWSYPIPGYRWREHDRSWRPCDYRWSDKYSPKTRRRIQRRPKKKPEPLNTEALDPPGPPPIIDESANKVVTEANAVRFQQRTDISILFSLNCNHKVYVAIAKDDKSPITTVSITDTRVGAIILRYYILPDDWKAGIWKDDSSHLRGANGQILDWECTLKREVTLVYWRFPLRSAW